MTYQTKIVCPDNACGPVDLVALGVTDGNDLVQVQAAVDSYLMFNPTCGIGTVFEYNAAPKVVSYRLDCCCNLNYVDTLTAGVITLNGSCLGFDACEGGEIAFVLQFPYALLPPVNAFTAYYMRIRATTAGCVAPATATVDVLDAGGTILSTIGATRAGNDWTSSPTIDLSGAEQGAKTLRWKIECECTLTIERPIVIGELLCWENCGDPIVSYRGCGHDEIRVSGSGVGIPVTDSIDFQLVQLTEAQAFSAVLNNDTFIIDGWIDSPETRAAGKLCTVNMPRGTAWSPNGIDWYVIGSDGNALNTVNIVDDMGNPIFTGLNNIDTNPIQLFPGDYTSILSPGLFSGPFQEVQCDFTVEPWDICDIPVHLEYSGLTTDPALIYKLPITPGLTYSFSDGIFERFIISDKLVVTYEGNTIYDSGLGDAGATVDFVITTNVDDFITFTFTSDPGVPPGTDTIWTLDIDCEICESVCSIAAEIPGYRSVTNNNLQRQIILKSCDNESAFAPCSTFSDALVEGPGESGAICNRIVDNATPDPYCFDLPGPTVTTATINGSGFDVDFTSTAAANAFGLVIAEINAQAGSPSVITLMESAGEDCTIDDIMNPCIGVVGAYNGASWSRVGDTWNYTHVPFTLAADPDCNPDGANSGNPFDNLKWVSFLNCAASIRSISSNTSGDYTYTPGTPLAGDFVLNTGLQEITVQWGTDFTACGINNNPVRAFTFLIDTDDPLWWLSFQLYEGSNVATGTLVGSAGTLTQCF